MTVHAGFRWGQTRKRTLFRRGMTIPAVEAELADVSPVTVGNRLCLWNSNLRYIGRTNESIRENEKSGHEQDNCQQYRFRDGVRSWSKYVRHKTLKMRLN